MDFFIECTRFEPTVSFAFRTNVRDQGFSPSAAGGGRSEGGKLAAVKIARRSKPQKRFWAPQVYAMGSAALHLSFGQAFALLFLFSARFSWDFYVPQICAFRSRTSAVTHAIFPFSSFRQQSLAHSPTKKNKRCGHLTDTPTLSRQNNRSLHRPAPIMRAGLFSFYNNHYLPTTSPILLCEII